MKKLFITLAITILFLSTTATKAAVRCGSSLINDGDSTHLTKVRLKKCRGEILDRESLKSEDADSVKRESWFIKVRSNCHILEFVDGKIASIESERCY